jgi:hypothetical protein
LYVHFRAKVKNEYNFSKEFWKVTILEREDKINLEIFLWKKVLDILEWNEIV